MGLWEVRKIFSQDVNEFLKGKVMTRNRGFIESHLDRAEVVCENIITFLMLEHEIERDVFINCNETQVTISLTLRNENTKRDAFLSQYCRAEVGVSENTYVLTYNRNFLICEVFRFLSAIPQGLKEFIPTDNLTDLDKAVLKNLSDSKYEEAVGMIEDWYENAYGETRLRNALQIYADGMIEQKLKHYTDNIEHWHDAIRMHEANIRNLLAEIRGLNEQIEETSLVIQNMKSNLSCEEEISSMTNFIRDLKGVRLNRGEEIGELVISLRQPLSSVDPALLEVVLEGKSSLYSFAPNKEDAKMLFEAIWKHKTVSLYTYSAFTMIGLKVSPGRNAECDKSMKQNSVEHPHIMGFGCLGGFVESFTEIALSGDFYSAIMTMISSAKSFNLADSVVCAALSESIFSRNGAPFLYKEKYYSAENIIRLLKEEQNAENQNG